MWRLRYPRLNDCVGAWCPSRDAARGTMRLTDQRPARNHGTLTNMTADDWVLSPGAGGGYALDFDGSNDHVILHPSKSVYTLCGLSATQVAVAVSIWVRLAGSPGTRQVVLGDWNASALDETFRIEVSGFGAPANKWMADVLGKGGSAPLLSSTADAVVGEWTHIVAQKVTDTSNELWINGKLDSTTNKATSVYPVNSQKIALGRAGDYGGVYFSGQIDDARIYARALCGAEIVNLYRLGRGGAYALEYVPIGKAGAAPPAGSVPNSIHHYKMQGIM